MDTFITGERRKYTKEGAKGCKLVSLNTFVYHIETSQGISFLNRDTDVTVEFYTIKD